MFLSISGMDTAFGLCSFLPVFNDGQATNFLSASIFNNYDERNFLLLQMKSIGIVMVVCLPALSLSKLQIVSLTDQELLQSQATAQELQVERKSYLQGSLLRIIAH